VKKIGSCSRQNWRIIKAQEYWQFPKNWWDYKLPKLQIGIAPLLKIRRLNFLILLPKRIYTF